MIQQLSLNLPKLPQDYFWKIQENSNDGSLTILLMKEFPFRGNKKLKKVFKKLHAEKLSRSLSKVYKKVRVEPLEMIIACDLIAKIENGRNTYSNVTPKDVERTAEKVFESFTHQNEKNGNKKFVGVYQGGK